MKPRILFVDDDEFIRKIYKDRLAASDFEATITDSVAETKHVYENAKFDIICLDHILPDGTGMDILKWMRGEKKSTLPIVVFSASGQEANIEEFMNAGATEFIQKDQVKPTDLIQKLEEILENKKNV